MDKRERGEESEEACEESHRGVRLVEWLFRETERAVALNEERDKASSLRLARALSARR